MHDDGCLTMMERAPDEKGEKFKVIRCWQDAVVGPWRYLRKVEVFGAVLDAV